MRTGLRQTRQTWRALWGAATFLAASSLHAAPVTAVVGSFNGFWTSSTSAINATFPDDSNELLAFSVGSGPGAVTYSTGVDDAALAANGIAFTAAVFRALPLTGTYSPSPSSLIGIASRWGGVDQIAAHPGGEVPDNAGRPLSHYLQDGRQGLELSTAIFNLPASSQLRVLVNGAQIDPDHIGDGVPDLLITQMGDPSRSADRFQFYDDAGTPIGTNLAVNFSSVPRVGRQHWTFYSAASGNPSFGTNGIRDMRLLALDFSDLGITPANASQVAELRQTLSGAADPAFVAYNARSLPVHMPELALTKTLSPAEGVPGSELSFTLSVSNQSTVAPTQSPLTIRDTLPAGLTPISATGSDWSCDVAGQTVTCTYTPVLNAGTSTPAITLMATADAGAGGLLRNVAEVSGGGDENCPALPRCQATATFTVSSASSPQPVPTLGTMALLLGGLMLGMTGWRRHSHN